MEFAEAINHASMPRQIPGKGGVQRVLCHDPSENTRVLRQMKGLLLDEGPSEAGRRRCRPRGHAPLSRLAWETPAQGSGPAPRKAGSPQGRTAGLAETQPEATGRWAQQGQEREPGGSPTTLWGW